MRIDWNEPFIRFENVLKICPADLNDFYADASEVDRLNLFFVLLNTLQRCQSAERIAEAAHVCFLIAYYLFVPLTPPGSWELSMHYIRQAISLNPIEEYREWLGLIEQGN